MDDAGAAAIQALDAIFLVAARQLRAVRRELRWHPSIQRWRLLQVTTDTIRQGTWMDAETLHVPHDAVVRPMAYFALPAILRNGREVAWQLWIKWNASRWLIKRWVHDLRDGPPQHPEDYLARFPDRKAESLAAFLQQLAVAVEELIGSIPQVADQFGAVIE